MRVQLILCLLTLSLSARAVDDRSMSELFRKYDQVMVQKKTEFIDDVFSRKFLKESGGKKEFVEKVKGLPDPSTKKASPSKVSWKKGLKDDIYLVKMKDAEFIVVKEDGKLKIDGTASDAQ